MANLIRNALLLSGATTEAFTRPGGSGVASRGQFEDMLREVAMDFKGLSGRMQGPVQVGRCADRPSSNQCCAGSTWDCQAPGSTCSCDQMCSEFGDCCPDYVDVCSNAFQDSCEDREAEVNLSEKGKIMFDDVGNIIPVLVGPEAGRVGGDPHYHTFDGTTVHYQGGCTYQITGLCHSAVGSAINNSTLTDFKVYAKNYQTFKEKKDKTKKPMAWINDVIVEFPTPYSKIYLVIGQGNTITMSRVFEDGSHMTEDITKDQLPYTITDLNGEFVGLLYTRVKYLRVQIGNDGLVVQFNGQTNFKINMPCKYNGNVCGLLGNADNDPSNDNLKPDGSIAASHNELGDSWLENSFPEHLGLNTEVCDTGLAVTDPDPECPALDLREAAGVCKRIIDTAGPFQECHGVVAPAEYFEDCVYDTCLFIMNDLDTQNAKCDSFQDYAEACRDAGVAIDWRPNAQCEVTCPSGSSYHFDHYHEEETCEGTRQVAVVGETAEGCFCDAGFVKSGENCISVDKCFSHCSLDSGLELEIGEEHFNAECSSKCICVPNYADSSLPPITECHSDGCRHNEYCVAEGASGKCEAIQFNSAIKEDSFENGMFGEITFITEDHNLDCLIEKG